MCIGGGGGFDRCECSIYRGLWVDVLLDLIAFDLGIFLAHSLRCCRSVPQLGLFAFVTSWTL